MTAKQTSETAPGRLPASAAGVAIGWRVHSGWASQIALAGPLAGLTVVARRRVELVDPAVPGSRQPYHAARALPLAAAERWIGGCRDATRRLARRELEATVDGLRRQGYRTVACGLLDSSARPLPALAAVLASHALVHTAEGELFRQALVAASQDEGFPVTRMRERDLLDLGAATLGIAPERIQQHLAQIGATLGPPWRQDEKLATLIAWLALAAAP
jgi:hypothetical protein